MYDMLDPKSLSPLLLKYTWKASGQ